ncbi:MAG: hypothetical protein IJW15_03620 [Clostridia bacterium]|nr:hypothetical protein [Clostridia bacterium]
MKKLLSILLTGVMLVSVFAISASAFVPERVITVVPAQDIIVQNFDGTNETDFTASSTTNFISPTVRDGVLKIEATSNSAMGYGFGVVSATEPTTTSYTVEFDIKKTAGVVDAADTGYSVMLGMHLPKYANHAALGAFAFLLPISDLAVGSTRSFYLEIDESVALNATSDQVEKTTVSGAVNIAPVAKYKDDNGSWVAMTKASTISSTNFKVVAGAADHNDGVPSSAWISNIYATGINIGARRFSGSTDYRDNRFELDNIKFATLPSTSESDLAIKSGVNYSQDFDAGLGNFVDANGITYEAKTESDGNTFYRLSASDLVAYASNTGAASIYSTINNTNAEVLNIAAPNSTITLDVRYVTKGAPLTILIGKSKDYYEDTTLGKRPIALGLFPRELDKWYTYKIVLGNFATSDDINNFIDVYVKERGAADSTYTLLENKLDIGNDRGILVWNDPSSAYNMDSYDYGYKNGWTSPDDGKNVHIGFNTLTLQNASWTTDVISATVTDIDNFQATTGCAITGSYADGAAELYVDTNEEKETVIVASYDTGDILKDVKFVELTGGADNEAELNVTVGTAATKLYVWNSLVGGKPILANPITLQ